MSERTGAVPQGSARPGKPDGHGPFTGFLSASPERKAQVLSDIATGAVPGPIYYILLLSSAGIAAFGLLANSAAVVIGAMLVSPLMAPIFGTSLALTRGDLRLLRTAASAEVGGVLLIIAFAFLMGLMPFSLEVTPEMLARTKPSLLDLFVATLAGLAGGLALVDEKTSPALPGVAIATSLTPPLATCGLSLAFGAYAGAWGAFLLFFANFLAILFVTAAIFIIAGFVTRQELGSRRTVLKRFSAAGIGLIAVAAILTRQLVVIIEDWRIQSKLVGGLETVLADDPGARLASVVYQKATDDALNVLATVSTPRPFSPQRVETMQKSLSAATQYGVTLFIRNPITYDIAAAGSANLLPTVNLNGQFVDAHLTPTARMTEIAEQTFRELVSRRDTFDFQGIELIRLPSGPVFVATVDGPRQPVPLQVKYAEDVLKKRLDDPTAALLVRASTFSNITSKGRILLGEAQFGALSDADLRLQKTIETTGKTEFERLANTFVDSIDAAPVADGWEARAEVISAQTLRPADVAQVERALAAAASAPVKLTVLTPGGLIVTGDGYTTVRRTVEAGVARQLQAQEAAGALPPAAAPQ